MALPRGRADWPLGRITSMSQTVIESGVRLTQAAAAKVSELLAAEDQALVLRVAVQPGSCAGLSYQMYFDDQVHDDDVVTTSGDVRVVVDAVSAPYLAGVVIDFADEAQRQGFTVDNPNAGGCACGGCSCGCDC